MGLCPGYRHIPLFNEVGQPMSLPSLFVLITVGDYVPNAWTDLADALTNPIKHQSEIERRNKMLEVLTDELETSETDTKQGQDEPQSPLAMAGTPEAASPTVENLKRIGSNTKKLVSDILIIFDPILVYVSGLLQGRITSQWTSKNRQQQESANKTG